MKNSDWRRLDEQDVRVRANPRGSRPRSKQRPDHADAVPARITAVDRGRYVARLVETDQTVEAMKARELAKSAVVVGDLAYLVGDTSGAPGTLARIVRVAPRQTVLRRSPDDADPSERVIVAGADQLVVVTALANPAPRPRMIDRCLVAAYDASMDAVLCLTKADLAPGDAAEELRRMYEPLGAQVVTTGRVDRDSDIDGLARVRELLAGRVSVLVGHSGVGKSTLVNALATGAGRATGKVNAVTGRGRHVSSSAVALPLDGVDGGWIIDTPGVRSFGLGHVDPARLLAAFEDLAQAAKACPRGCTHEASAPDCALDEWVAAAAADDGQRAPTNPAGLGDPGPGTERPEGANVEADGPDPTKQVSDPDRTSQVFDPDPTSDSTNPDPVGRVTDPDPTDRATSSAPTKQVSDPDPASQVSDPGPTSQATSADRAARLDSFRRLMASRSGPEDRS